MKRTRIWLSAAMALMIAVFGFLVAPSALFTAVKKAEKKPAKFSKVEKKTKVDPVHAAQGDIVAWSDASSDLYFNFMNVSLFGVESASVRKGGTLELTVKANAESGTYPYAIFRLADSTFVIGNSPPTIIVP